MFYFIIYFSIIISVILLIRVCQSSSLIIKIKRSLQKKSQQKNNKKNIYSRDILIVSSLISGVITSVLLLLKMNIIFAVVMFISLLLLIHAVLSKRKIQKKLEEFDKSLIDALPIMSSSLRAGATLPEALEHSCDGLGKLYGEQIRLALSKFHLGVALEDCLETIEQNMPTRSVSMVTNSLIISWQSGGNLPEVLDEISTTIRERFRVEGKLKALTAQGRTQANILCMAPFCITLLMYFVDPHRTQLLFTTFPGKIVIGISAFLIVTGYAVTQKMLKLEV